MLEYYEGILFLTTNRLGYIDAAFQSRIHVSMRYDEPGQDARKSIAKNFLKSRKGSGDKLKRSLDDPSLQR